MARIRQFCIEALENIEKKNLKRKRSVDADAGTPIDRGAFNKLRKTGDVRVCKCETGSLSDVDTPSVKKENEHRGFFFFMGVASSVAPDLGCGGKNLFLHFHCPGFPFEACLISLRNFGCRRPTGYGLVSTPAFVREGTGPK